MKQFLTTIIFVFAFATLSHIAGAQNMAINTDGSTPDASAMVDIASTTKGFLLPRMTTTQQNAIPLPATGLLIFNTTDNAFKVNTGTPAAPVWTPLIYSGNAITSINGLTGTIQTFTTGTTGTDFTINSSGGAHTFNIPTASATNRGALSAADWSIFNGKQPALGFTPYNATNPAGYISSSSLAGATDATISSPANGQVLQYNIVTGKWVNTTPGFLSSYTETDPVVKAINGIIKSNGTTISAAVAGTDYVIPSGNITGSAGSFTGNLAGEVTGTQSATVVGNAAVIGKVLTGYTSGSGTVAATDNILQAIQKINGNVVLKAPLASPTFTGVPAAPTAIAGTNTTQIATTAFVTSAVSAGTSTSFSGNLAGEVTGTQSATVVGNGAVIGKVLTGYTSGAGTVAATDNILQAIQKINGNDVLKAPLASPTLTGTPAAPTATAGTNTTQIATTAFVAAANATNANLTGPITSTGNVTAITAQTGTGTTFVMSASPTLTGSPAAPTATAGTNTTQIATTAFVNSAITNSGWTLTGNSGITQPAVPATYGTSALGSTENFLGTKDGKDMVLAAANVERMRILNTNGWVGIGTAAPSKPLDLVGNLTSGMMKIQNTNAAGYSSIDIWSNTTQVGNIGFANNGATYSNSFYFATNTTNPMVFATNNTQRILIDGNNGNMGVGLTAPTAALHIKAGTAVAGTAPLKFTSGVSLTTPEDGAVEYNGTHFYGTVGTTRYQLDQQPSFTGNLAGDVTGTQSATIVGKINGTALAGLGTGILKNTTGTGVPSIAVAADFPTLNQNTTGTAAGLSANIAESQVTNLTTDLAAKAPLASPALTGIPAAPTASAGTNTTQIATTAFVTSAVSAGTSTSFSGSLAGEVTGTQGATVVGNGAVIGKVLTGYTSGSGTVTATDNILQAIQKINGNDVLKAPLASPTLTGTPAAPTATAGTNTTQIATTAFVTSAVSAGTSTSFSGSLAGEVTGTQGTTVVGNGAVIGKVLTGYTSGSGTVTATDNILQAIQKINGNDVLKAPLASPTLTGTPAAPTATAGTNTTQIATTAFVTSAVSAGTSTSFSGSLAGEVTGTQGATVVGNGAVIGKVLTGYTSGSGMVAATDNILQAIQKINGNDALKAPIASPTLTGTPAAPTATAGTNTTQIATTAFVTSAINSGTAASWGLTGNSVTPGSQFLGSTNNASLRMRTNNAERMLVDSVGNVGIGITNPAYKLAVKDSMEIRRTTSMSQLLFTNTAGSGDFRIGGDGADIYWQGGGGRSLQMGSYWSTILGGDRQSNAFPPFVNGIGGTSVIVAAQRDASVPLGIQANSATQTANLTEWRNSAGSVLDFIDKSGNTSIGGAALSATNPEQLLVDAATTTSVNAIVGRGSINNYLQLNIQNNSAGANASSDVVATANNGSETTNYVDMGINGGSNTSNIMGGANDGYLYTMGNNFLLGTGNASKSLVFMTGGTTQSTNERMRIDGTGNVGIGTNVPRAYLDVNNNSSSTIPALKLGKPFAGSSSTDSLLTWNPADSSVRRITASSVLSSFTLPLMLANGVASSTTSLRDYDAWVSQKTYGGNFVTDAAATISSPIPNEGAWFALSNVATYPNSAGANSNYFGQTSLNDHNFYFRGGTVNTGSGVVTSPGWQKNLSIPASSQTAISIDASNNATFNVVDNAAFKVSTNNTERMQIDKSGNVAFGTSTFNAANPEQLVVDASTTSSVNAIVGKGSINNYLQLNIQNGSSGNAASSDVVATANNGSETTNYVDMGINGGGNTSGVMGGANDGYLYTMGNNFLIGTGNTSKSLIFMTGGTSQSANERARIDGSGNVGIGNTSPNSTLSVTGSHSVSYRSGTGAYTISNSDYVVINTGGGTPTWTLPLASSYAGRIYRLINHGTTSVILSQSITTASGVTSATLSSAAGSNTYEIVSDGSVWRKMD